MSNPAEPHREHPSTYFVQDRSMEEELTRLRMQDQVLTASMGGVLSEQPDPTSFQRVLDVGCGSGDWLIAAAKLYPTMSQLVGVDISSHMIEYARTQAEAQQVGDRVQFRTMDALRMLEFPSASFDLVNQRSGWSFLRTWDWPKILSEYQRVCKPGGVIRITEADITQADMEIMPAAARLTQLFQQAFFQAGHFFTAAEDGVTSQLARLLQQAGLKGVQTRAYAPGYPEGTPERELLYQNTKHLFRTALPFLRKWTRVPDDYEALYQQAMIELQQPGFIAKWSLLTAWGTKPGRKSRKTVGT